jgi:transcription antitermination factor NusG
VVSIVGGQKPIELAAAEIETLRSGLRSYNFAPHPLLTVGQRVRIKSGPLDGMEGILVRRKNNFRVVITVEAIQKSVAIEIDADQVDPILGRSASSN